MSTTTHNKFYKGGVYFHASRKCEEERVYAILSVINNNTEYPQMGDFVACEDGKLNYWTETKKRFPLNNIIGIHYVLDQ
uniref:Uncharacterized protein n=1 Tax=Borely moumouvirus TaxID=2712067 RepID=A0A6G6AE92_9VIRU